MMLQRYPIQMFFTNFGLLYVTALFFPVLKYSRVQGKITRIFGRSFLIRRSLLTISFYSFIVSVLLVSNHRHPDPLIFRVTFFSSRSIVKKIIFKSATKITNNYLIRDKTKFINCHDRKLK